MNTCPTPSPLRVREREPSRGSSLYTVTVSEKSPTASGPKRAVMSRAPPGGTVCGKVAGLGMVKEGSLVTMLSTVRLTAPTLWALKTQSELLPTVTCP
jgi:hypothetical protein